MKLRINRRKFLRAAIFGGAGAAASTMTATGASAFFRHLRLRPRPAPAPLDAATLDKFVNNLVNPLGDVPLPVLRPSSSFANLRLTIRQSAQSLGLSTNGGLNKLPPTPVWGYQLTGNVGVSVTNPIAAATYPGPTFELNRGQPMSVTFDNGLVNVAFPRYVPVDTTLDWANPGGLGGTSPIPVVTHLHGARTTTVATDQGRSDGGPLGWSTPSATYKGPQYLRTYTYDNDQEAGLLWYHDHSLGTTRTNVYMGLAGFYVLRDANENLLRKASPTAPVLPSYPYEIPIVIQDRMFQADGSLFYPSTPYPDPAIPAPNPTHLPEFFGDVILVNTLAWPKKNVEPRKYRLRLLNGSDSRVYELSFTTPQNTKLPLWVIGNELGLLNLPVRASLPPDSPTPGVADSLMIAPGERYDVIVDFSQVPLGTNIIVRNTAPTPYPGGTPPVAGTTDQIMMFSVVTPKNAAIADATVSATTILRNRAPGTPVLSAPNPSTASVTRKLFLFEGTDAFGRLQTMIGVVGPAGPTTGTMVFSDPVTETPLLNSTEVWEIHNTTADAHPIHLHLVHFRIINRQAITYTLTAKVNTNGSSGAYVDNIVMAGPAVGPRGWEAGRKDTVVVYPDQVVRVMATFEREGDFVYHCHILSHEDHEMMRPFRVVRQLA